MIAIKDFRDHITEAEHLLALAKMPATPQTKAIAYIYECVVELTQALKKLETRHDD